MARYTGPKNKISRREGIDLGLKTIGSKSHASLLRKINVPPGIHGPKGRRRLSDYGNQLREKQKVKRMYGVLEKQFRKVFKKAKKWKGHTGKKLLEFLERRLDNVVYRAGLAPTRGLSRQLVGHGHVLVDNKKVDIPSYLVQEKQVITLKPKALEIPAVKKILETEIGNLPGWIARKGPVVKINRLPVREDITEDISEQLIVEYYSR